MLRPNIEEIEARAEAATRGPWAWESVGEGSWCLGVVDPPMTGEIVEKYDDERRVFEPKPEVVEGIADNGVDGTMHDAAFISHARTDVPELIAYIRHLEAERFARESKHFEQLTSVFDAVKNQVQDEVEKMRAIANEAVDEFEREAGTMDCALYVVLGIEEKVNRWREALAVKP